MTGPARNGFNLCTKMTVTCGGFRAYGDGEDCKDAGTYLSLESQKESGFGGFGVACFGKEA